MTPAMAAAPWLASYPAGVPSQLDTGAARSLGELLEAAFRAHGPSLAYVWRDHTTTYDEVDTQSAAVAAWLQGLGLATGARVGVMLPTLLCYPFVLFGILRSGCTAVCINPHYTAPELRHVLADSGAEVLFLMQDHAAQFATVRAASQVRQAVVVGRNGEHDVDLSTLPALGPVCNLAGLLGEAQALPRCSRVVAPEDIALLQYTGGTTGVSRGAQLTHANVVANVLQAHAWITPALRQIPHPPPYTFACVLPLFHIFGLTACCLLGAHLGALNLLVANPFDVRGAVAQLTPYRVNLMPAVSTLYGAMLSDPRVRDIDFSALRVCIAGGMKLQPAVADRWLTLTGCPIVEAYGLSETSPMVSCNPFDGSARLGSIGLPVTGTEVAIVDDAGQPLPLGEVGEVAVRGPQVMAGYWRNPEDSARVMTPDGFFLTGDVGTMDAQGFTHIVERKKDLILVGGFNVYPSEVEAAAVTHLDVADCACIGVPDANSGEAVKLFVVRKPDAHLTANQLLTHCRTRLAGYKLPRHVVFIESIPRTHLGKVSRQQLRELPVPVPAPA